MWVHVQAPFGEELLGNYSGIRNRALQEKGQVVRRLENLAERERAAPPSRCCAAPFRRPALLSCLAR